MRSFDEVQTLVDAMVELQISIKEVNPDEYVADARDYFMSYVRQTIGFLSQYAIKHDKKQKSVHPVVAENKPPEDADA